MVPTGVCNVKPLRPAEPKKPQRCVRPATPAGFLLLFLLAVPGVAPLVFHGSVLTGRREPRSLGRHRCSTLTSGELGPRLLDGRRAYLSTWNVPHLVKCAGLHTQRPVIIPPPQSRILRDVPAFVCKEAAGRHRRRRCPRPPVTCRRVNFAAGSWCGRLSKAQDHPRRVIGSLAGGVGAAETFQDLDDVPVCDQCGGARARRELTECRSCRVAFAQCQLCSAHYSGCCSMACRAQASALDGTSTDASTMSGAVSRTTPPGETRLTTAGLNPEDVSTLAEPTGVVPTSGFPEGPTVSESLKADVKKALLARETARSPGSLGDHGDSADDGHGQNRVAPSLTASAVSSSELQVVREEYASRFSSEESACLADIRRATDREQPHGAHMVSGHVQGELLKALTRLIGARNVLDIGTFTGYSALAFAQALPGDGTVVTLESDPKSAETARRHFAKTEDGAKIRLMLGQAMNSIHELVEEGWQFDVVFIDADKKRYWDYFNKVLGGSRPLLAPKGILLADNVLFHDLVPVAENKASDARSRDVGSSGPPTSDMRSPACSPRRLKIATALHEFNARIRSDKRVEVVLLPLRDGLSIIRWRDESYPG